MKIIPSNLSCVLIMVGLVCGNSSFAARTDALEAGTDVLEAGGIYPTVSVAEVPSSVPPAEEGPAVPTTSAVPGGPGVPRLDADPAEVEGFLASLESVGDGGQYAKEQARSKLYEHATTFGNLSAVKALAIAAERGDFMAQGYLCISITYYNYFNEDIERARVLALKCIDKIRAEVSKNNPYAQWILGKMYERGILLTNSYGLLHYVLDCIIGTEKERRGKEARRLYQLSTDQGYVPAQFSLGEWRKAAEQGLAEAQCELAFQYLNGMDVAEDADPDYARAAFWFRKAADQGLAEAQYKLAYMYENGRGVPKDEEKAAFWRDTAVARNAPNPYCLGWMYENGVGVDKDKARAIFWYSDVEMRQYPGAIEALSRLQSASSADGRASSAASVATGIIAGGQ
jgi:TPR repeat protein